MLESVIEKKAGELCKKHNVLFYKFSSPSNRGVPDRIMVFPGGKVVFVEFKAPGKKPTALQLHTARRISAQGAETCVFDDYPLFERWLHYRTCPQE